MAVAFLAAAAFRYEPTAKVLRHGQTEIPTLPLALQVSRIRLSHGKPRMIYMNGIRFWLRMA